MQGWYLTKQDAKGFKYQAAMEEGWEITENEETGLVQAHDYKGELMWKIQMVREKYWEEK